MSSALPSTSTRAASPPSSTPAASSSSAIAASSGGMALGSGSAPPASESARFLDAAACNPGVVSATPALARPVVGVWLVEGYGRVEIMSDAKGAVSADVYGSSNADLAAGPISASWKGGWFSVSFSYAAGNTQTISFRPSATGLVEGTLESVTEDVSGPKRQQWKDPDTKLTLRRICP